jgi:hypothetical protein
MRLKYGAEAFLFLLGAAQSMNRRAALRRAGFRNRLRTGELYRIVL